MKSRITYIAIDLGQDFSTWLDDIYTQNNVSFLVKKSNPFHVTVRHIREEREEFQKTLDALSDKMDTQTELEIIGLYVSDTRQVIHVKICDEAIAAECPHTQHITLSCALGVPAAKSRELIEQKIGSIYVDQKRFTGTLVRYAGACVYKDPVISSTTLKNNTASPVSVNKPFAGWVALCSCSVVGTAVTLPVAIWMAVVFPTAAQNPILALACVAALAAIAIGWMVVGSVKVSQQRNKGLLSSSEELSLGNKSEGPSSDVSS